MDIALVLDKIRPGAAWRMADTYEMLAATWEDTVQTLPTEREIVDAWATMEAEKAWTGMRAERDKRLKDPVITDRIDRYRNQYDAGLPTTDTDEWFQAALEYLQVLRDLPENTTDPAAPDWPVPPA